MMVRALPASRETENEMSLRLLNLNELQPRQNGGANAPAREEIVRLR